VRPYHHEQVIVDKKLLADIRAKQLPLFSGRVEGHTEGLDGGIMVT
jgi:hypothetical protein